MSYFMNVFICFFVGFSLASVEQSVAKLYKAPKQKQFKEVCMQSIENVLADKNSVGKYLVPTLFEDSELDEHFEVMCSKKFSELLRNKYCYDGETEVIIKNNEFYFKMKNFARKIPVAMFYFHKDDKTERITYTNLMKRVKKQVGDYYKTGGFGNNYKVKTREGYHRIYHLLQFNGSKLWFSYYLKRE